MSEIVPLSPVQRVIAAGSTGELDPDLFLWLTRLATVCNAALVPPRAVFWVDLDAAKIAIYFTSSGLGAKDGPYMGFHLCNGQDGYPDLDSKFVRASTTAAGTTGGSDSSAHTHAIDHDHDSFTSAAASGGTSLNGAGLTNVSRDTHTHEIDVPAFTGTSGAASSTENRPAFYELVPIMRVEVI